MFLKTSGTFVNIDIDFVHECEMATKNTILKTKYSYRYQEVTPSG